MFNMQLSMLFSMSCICSERAVEHVLRDIGAQHSASNAYLEGERNDKNRMKKFMSRMLAMKPAKQTSGIVMKQPTIAAVVVSLI